jgi:TonB family protein
MPRDARFWRNATIIAAAHIAVVIALVYWNHEKRKPNLQSIVWLSGASAEIAERTVPAPPLEATPPPEPDTPRAAPDEPEEASASPPAKSSIQLPAATPSPAPTPLPKRSATPIPKPTAKPTPKPSPKKPAPAGASPKPSPKNSATPSKKNKTTDEPPKEPAKIAPTNTKSDDGRPNGSPETSGQARSSEFSWYGKMLHDRFYSEWIQPTTSVAVGAKMSALVRIRIEPDGRISKFTLVRPSGNVVVDESVAAVANRVTQVDPLPKGLAGGAFYEVNINFELNPEQ